MKLLFVNQFYWPDAAATAQQMSDLAEWLVEQGHEVQILCSRGAYESASRTGDDQQANAPRQIHKGVRIRRLGAPGLGKKSTLSRIIDYAGFHLLCGLWMLLFAWRYHAIITLTTPPLIGIYATLIRWLSFGRVRHVTWVMDLHPDCEFELGIWSRRNPLFALLGWLNNSHLRHAHCNVALGPAMQKRLVDKNIPAERVQVIGVWSRADAIEPKPMDDVPLRKQFHLDEKFIVMYSGNAGLIHSFDAIERTMLTLRDDPNIHFVFIGSGKRLNDLNRFVQQHQLGNFLHLPYFPREQLSDSLAMGHAHLVTLRTGMAGVALPCKTYGIMAAGRPIIYVGPRNSDTAHHVKQANCGWIVEEQDDAELTRVIRTLASDHAAAETAGHEGRAWLLQHAERKIGCQRWQQLLEQVGK